MERGLAMSKSKGKLVADRDDDFLWMTKLAEATADLDRSSPYWKVHIAGMMSLIQIKLQQMTDEA
jgi:hypothetical protein